MTAQKTPSAFGKLPGGLLVLSVVVLGCWALYEFGPRPSVASTRPETVAPAQPPKPPEAGVAKSSIEECQAPIFSNPLGMAASGGRVAESSKAYLDRLEKLYILRGYKSFNGYIADTKKARKRQPELTSFYWRMEPEGSNISYIGATGSDADPNKSESSSDLRSCTTIVSPAIEGGSQWATYCSEILNEKSFDPSDLEKSAADSAGTDPPGIPRPKGLRRVLSFDNSDSSGRKLVALYTSTEPGASLVNWYLSEMSRNWRLEPMAAAQAGEVLQGAMTFTQGRRFCLIWVSPGVGGDPTTVTISLQQ